MRANLLILTTLACAASFFFSCADGSIEAAALVACGKFDPEKQICDARDGNLYGFTKIDNKFWLSENLRYSNGLSRCYDDNPEYCSKYGRLYLWNEAENKKLCPDGWHIPGISEWDNLGMAATDYELKATSGWEPYGNRSGNGEGRYGFNALPAGVFMFEFAEEEGCNVYLDEYGNMNFSEWYGIGSVTAFMSNTARWVWVMLSNDNDPREPCIGVNSLVSVRCIKD